MSCLVGHWQSKDDVGFFFLEKTGKAYRCRGVEGLRVVQTSEVDTAAVLCVCCHTDSRLGWCRGSKTKPILPLTEAGPAALEPQERDWDILLTAETHNFPCAVAPYPGLRLLPNCCLSAASSGGHTTLHASTEV